MVRGQKVDGLHGVVEALGGALRTRSKIHRCYKCPDLTVVDTQAGRREQGDDINPSIAQMTDRFP